MLGQASSKEKLLRPIGGMSSLESYLSLPLVFSLLGAVIFFIAWNRGIALMYALFAIMAAVVGCSFAGARLMLRPATAKFVLPKEAAVGEAISVKINIIATCRPYRRRLVQLISPFSFAPDQQCFLPNCGGEIEHVQRVRCTRRGEFTIRTMQVACAYPIGLAKASRVWNVEAVAITVFPRVYPIKSLKFSASSYRISAELEKPIPSVGQELFREVREYRSGDNPRHIHWRSSARQGHLVVKQFDAISTSEAWIILDLDPSSHAGNGEHHSFERAVEIASSVATSLIQSGFGCGIAGGLRADGTPQLFIPPDTGQGQLRMIMHALASVQADCAVEYETLLAAMAEHCRPGQQLILFRHTERPIALPPRLRNKRPPFWFRFDTGSFADTDIANRQIQPPIRQSDGMLIGRDSDLEHMFI